MGRGRGREDPLRQYVGRVPRQERCVGAVVPHAVCLGQSRRRSDDHRPPRPHRRLHHLLRGALLLAQHPPPALRGGAVDRCRGPSGHRPHHLPRQVQRADLRGQLLLHLGVRLRLGCHHPLHRLRHPLLLPAALRGRADRPGQDQIHLLLGLKAEPGHTPHRGVSSLPPVRSAEKFNFLHPPPTGSGAGRRLHVY